MKVRLLNKITKKHEKVIILPASWADLIAADKSGNFQFSWESEKKKEVFKLQVEASREVLGMMALKDMPHEIRIDINAIEASKQNVGVNKVYEGIAGFLIAFACRQAFLRGYGGFVSLTPKTLLIEHYRQVYGFTQMGTKLCTYDENSETLIETYLKG